MKNRDFDNSQLGSFTVLGRKLQPLTIGHQAILERFDSGFAGGGREPTYADLIFSVFVCSLPYAAAADALQHRIKTLLRVRLWGLRVGRFDLPEAVANFAAYLVENRREPDYWQNDFGGGGSKSTTPFSQFLKLWVREHFGVSEGEALATPFRVALVDYLTALEQQGVIRFFTDLDRELIAKANEVGLHERILAKAGAVK